MKPKRFINVLLLLISSTLFGQEIDNAPFLDPNLSPDLRAADLVSRMTLEEKVLQMQSTAPAIPRLGVPAYNWWNEALHGVAQGRATVFPQAIGLAATWDTDLMYRVADIISTEARAKYNDALTHPTPSGSEALMTLPGRTAGLTYWSPNINIFRDPRWGRGQETYGEDPFLTGRMGVAFVTGMQGDLSPFLGAEFTDGNHTLGLQADVDDDVFVRDFEDLAFDDLALGGLLETLVISIQDRTEVQSWFFLYDRLGRVRPSYFHHIVHLLFNGLRHSPKTS